MKGTVIYHRSNRRFAVYQERLRSADPGAECRGNPLLWWCLDLDRQDYLVAGARTKREVMEAIEAACPMEGTDEGG